MVGAIDAFVRRPLPYRSVYYGLAGELGTWILVLLAGLVVANPLERLGHFYDCAFYLEVPGYPYDAVLLLGGAILGWLGSAPAPSVQTP